MDCWLGELVGRCGEQIKRRRALVENQGRFLVQRLLQRGNAQQKIRQLGILLEDRQRLGGLGLALAADARGLRLRLRHGFGGLTLGGGADFLRLGIAFGLVLADELLAFRLHALEHGLRDIFRQADFFEAEKFQRDAPVIRAQLGLHVLFNLAFNRVELQLLRVRVHQFGQRVLADDGDFCAAQHAFELALRVGDGHRRVAGKFADEGARVGNFPADINAGQQDDVVAPCNFR